MSKKSIPDHTSRCRNHEPILLKNTAKNGGITVSTTNIDSDGIEQENGLSTLMKLPEATEIFGENFSFEIKSIFTESLEFNLRNETANVLLDDATASSIGGIYAWWMILRIIIHSIITESPYRDQLLT